MVHARRSVAVVAIAATSLVAGCGESTSEKPITGTPTEQITETFYRYSDAVRKGDGGAACKLMTKAAKDELEESSIFVGTLGGCPDVVENISEQYKDEIDKAGDDHVTDVEITGTRARVTAGSSDPTYLTLAAGRWLVDKDPELDGTTSTPVAAKPGVKITDQGFTAYGSDNATWGVVLENPGPQDATGVEVVVRAEDGDGGLLSTSNQTVGYLPAGATLPVAGDLSTDGEGRPASLEMSVRVEGGAEAVTPAVPQARLGEPRVTEGEFGTRTVKVPLTNTAQQELSPIANIWVVFREDGEIIGGLQTFLRSDVAPGEEALVETSLFRDGLEKGKPVDVGIEQLAPDDE